MDAGRRLTPKPLRPHTRPLETILTGCTLGWIALLLASASWPVYGHRHTAPWLDETRLDQGLYLELRHPSVIRQPGSIEVSAVMSNLTGEGDVLVKQVRYVPAGSFDSVTHRPQQLLPTKRDPYRRYKAIQRELVQLAEQGKGEAAGRLYDESQTLLREITEGTFVDKRTIPGQWIPTKVGSSYSLTVQIDLLQNGKSRRLERRIVIPVQSPLPRGTGQAWLAGDQHLHTLYSIDAFFSSFNRDDVTDYARAAQVIGLDWIIISDHSNVDLLIWYDPLLFTAGESQARAFRQSQGYLVLQGEEMGAGSLGVFNEPAHLLAYPRSVDSTGFLENPCSLPFSGHLDCEPEQVILDRVNSRGGIGFIAHPFSSSLLFFAPWDFDNGAVGWAGMEIFNGGFGSSDEQSFGMWHELLKEIAPPAGGQLQDRPGFPTRFPVGLGNSDAHEIGSIGKTFSYARVALLPGESLFREALMEAFVSGRVVASNGPLVFGTINGAGTGEVALLSAPRNLLEVTLETTAEFGPVGDYEITVFVDGVERSVIPPSGSPEFQTVFQLNDLLGPADRFVTIRARRADQTFLALANPIWLEFQ
ncbi:MAG: CehA/McbA family metallohydrolase [Acidobacteriota bacterium]